MTRSALVDARVVRHGRVRFVAVCAGSGARERCEETTTRGTDCLKELELAARARGEFNFVWIAFDHRGAEARVKDRGRRETRCARVG